MLKNLIGSSVIGLHRLQIKKVFKDTQKTCLCSPNFDHLYILWWKLVKTLCIDKLNKLKHFFGQQLWPSSQLVSVSFNNMSYIVSDEVDFFYNLNSLREKIFLLKTWLEGLREIISFENSLYLTQIPFIGSFAVIFVINSVKSI